MSLGAWMKTGFKVDLAWVWLILLDGWTRIA